MQRLSFVLPNTSAQAEIGVINSEEGPLVRELNKQHRERLASIDLKRKAREMMRERLRTESCGLSLHDMEEASPDTRVKVEQIARALVVELQAHGREARAPYIPPDVAEEIVAYLLDWQFGAGPLQYLFNQPDVEDILINTTRTSLTEVAVQVFSFRLSGKRHEVIELTVDEVLDIVNRNAALHGRALNPTTPILNVQMRNGARINAVINPICDPALSVTIRIHRLVARSFDDLVRLGTLTPAAAAWLWLCVRSGLAMVIAGGTASGKTNFLNAVARVMNPALRMVVIEDTRELDLTVPDKVYLTTLHSADGTRMINQRQLVANAMRMRPSRIVIGEVRDAAAWDAIKATNTGHEGTLLTVHAEDADSVPVRLMQLCSEAPETQNLPERTLRQLIASAFQIVVFLDKRRSADGASIRSVSAINELNGFVSEHSVHRQALFQMQGGRLEWTKVWPHERIKRRILDAGFCEQDIEDALNGRRSMWQTGG